MQKGELTEKEKELLHTLLTERGITVYELFDVTNEGKSLPGGSYPLEIESLSGTLSTPTKIYDFWLNWVDGHYTLGEEDGFWRERRAEKLGDDKEKMLQLQQQLREGIE